MTMKKPAVTLRKPPALVSVETADRFVSGDHLNVQATRPLAVQMSDVQATNGLDVQVFIHPATVESMVDLESVSKTPPGRPRAVLSRKDGRELRRTTIYFPIDVAKKLALYCAERDRDLSDVVTGSVRQLLGE